MEESIHTDSSSQQPQSSVAMLVRKVGDEDYVRCCSNPVFEPGTCPQLDQFEWQHLVLNLHVLGTIMVDAGSRAASVTIHRVMDIEHGLGNVTGEIMLSTLLNHVTHRGKQECLEGAGFNQTVTNSCGSKNSKQCHKSKNFDECTTAHNDLHRNRGFSPWQLLRGKTPTDKSLCENPDLARSTVEVVDEAAKQRLRVKEESYKAYIEEELSLRKRRKEIHQARSWRHWASGDWCWYWRAGRQKGATMKGGVFLGPARVLLQERETTAEGGSYERCCLDY